MEAIPSIQYALLGMFPLLFFIIRVKIKEKIHKLNAGIY